MITKTARLKIAHLERLEKSGRRWPGYATAMREGALEVDEERGEIVIEVDGPCYILSDLKREEQAAKSPPDSQTPPTWYDKVLRALRPGELTHAIFKFLGVRISYGCGCSNMRRKMNKLGWRGCWRERKLLTRWFVGKLRPKLHDITRGYM